VGKIFAPPAPRKFPPAARPSPPTPAAKGTAPGARAGGPGPRRATPPAAGNFFFPGAALGGAGPLGKIPSQFAEKCVWSPVPPGARKILNFLANPNPSQSRAGPPSPPRRGWFCPNVGGGPPPIRPRNYRIGGAPKNPMASFPSREPPSPLGPGPPQPECSPGWICLVFTTGWRIRCPPFLAPPLDGVTGLGTPKPPPAPPTVFFVPPAPQRKRSGGFPEFPPAPPRGPRPCGIYVPRAPRRNRVSNTLGFPPPLPIRQEKNRGPRTFLGTSSRIGRSRNKGPLFLVGLRVIFGPTKPRIPGARPSDELTGGPR